MSSGATDNPSCPCCNNPWAAATGSFFAKLCETCEDVTPAAPGLSRKNMDFEVSPAENFFLYANGTWMKENPIPAGYPNWNTFLSLHVKSQENLKSLLEELRGKDDLTADEAKVGLFFKAAMDEDAIEKEGLSPLQPVLDLCDKAATATSDKTELATVLGTFGASFGIYPFFSIGASPDNKNSSHCIAQIAQGGLGLPDRDYYFDEDKEEKRVAYKKHVAKMLTLLDDPTKAGEEPTEAAVAAAEQIYGLEESLAKAHMTKTENRDPETTYNKMSIVDLTQKCGDKFPFASYIAASTNGKELGDINVRNVDALVAMAEVVSTVVPETLKNYLRWRSVRAYAPYLSKAFVEENFDFYEKTLSGTQEIKPRWKRAMAFTESALGEALGQLYCAKYFDETSKDRAVTIVEQVRQALEERLKEVDWMKSDSTREQALKKMAEFKVKIGYPDKWIDYTPMEIAEGDSFLQMVFQANAFEHSREVKEMNAPTDRLKWFMTPQTVNAYYHPSLNEIVFPAAILQPPFFCKEADDAINFGSMGAVVGHEMTHGFDDKGRKFNYEGNMVDWWTEDDATEYESRVQVMVKQADEFKVHGQSVQGKLTCGENIADLGGIRLAYRALKATTDFDEEKKIDGFTPTQRFFLGWGQCWRQNVTKDRALQLLTLDPHGPNEMRCNGPLSNIAEFHQAFDVAEGNPMYREAKTRVDIW
mmetsp:Transcript_39287/g.58358  ORF Transcript_39287/g.58358 Transcript_39287/m.58358 type:complete len:702 (-) Transcript_39287:193-2298(-)|eukprot:CAMPEP_0194037852 /NCGR_PEP_ID=MMETSP0009_2-20130614/10181_1 /TAXON_ID=210454 /ORGANISM="Grammatophora oceanica, Strain CCMP 410" /LENGTH=701 /DNA_ID=CAMNT_0038680181 /DNA_START=343 /DNA_END=2448 /DNA_ORIENTATION=-